MFYKPYRDRSLTVVLVLLWGVAAAVPAFGEDLAQELKKVPYRIAFESYRDQNWDLFTIRADGSDRINLTRTRTVHELCPHVSSDGRKVCFVVDEGEAEQRVRSVWYMNADGTGRQLVARSGREPCWAAGDRGIVWLKSEFAEFTAMDYATKGLFVHDLATGQNREHPNVEIQHLYCVCSTPDGKWYIATVHAGMGCTHAILAIEAQGRRVVNLSLPGCRPDVSPDGKRIAWASGNFALAIGDLDFSGPEPCVRNVHDILTSPKPMKIQHIDWSPDGRYVAFSRGPYKKGLGLAPSLVGVAAPGWNLCVADPNTTNRWVAITSDGDSNKEPDWVPIVNERR